MESIGASKIGTLTVGVSYATADTSVTATAHKPVAHSFDGWKAQQQPANVKLAGEYFQAIQKGDFDKVGRILDKNVAWYQPGFNQFSGTHKGRGADQGLGRPSVIHILRRPAYASRPRTGREAEWWQNCGGGHRRVGVPPVHLAAVTPGRRKPNRPSVPPTVNHCTVQNEMASPPVDFPGCLVRGVA